MTNRIEFNGRRARVLKTSLFLAGVLAGGLVGYFLFGAKAAFPPSSSALRIHDPKYKFISPLLATGDSPAAKSPTAFKPLEDKLKAQTYDFLNNQSDKVSAISVYFRDLNAGRWIGINENADYDPASLLKVPVMIAWLLKADQDPTIFQKKFLFKGEAGDAEGQQFHSLTPGAWYTVDELLASMITKSDNDAKDLLVTSIDIDTLNEAFSDLGITVVGNDLNAQYVISAKTYSLFFRILYNATYLSHELSEKALELLDKTDFNDGLVAGVPADTAVAHKFGQYGNSATTATASVRELHDCGIVYHPQRPYLLCVMTKGSAPLNILKQVIKTVSQTVYAEVDTNYK